MSISKRNYLSQPPNLSFYGKQVPLEKQSNFQEGFNESRIYNKTQRTEFKDQESILDDFGVLLQADGQNPDLSLQDREQSDQQWQFVSKYEKALQLISIGNNFSNKSAFRLFLSLGKEVKNSSQKQLIEKSYEMVENIVLNIWRLGCELEPSLASEIIYSLIDYIGVLEEIYESQKAHQNKLTFLSLVLAKELFKRGDVSRVLEYCEKGFKYCPRFKNSSLLLKLHFLKSKVYNQIKALSPQYEEVKKCLFYLKNISKNVSENQEFGHEFVRVLNARRQQLKGLLEGAKPYKQKIQQSNSQHKQNRQTEKPGLGSSLNKFRKKSISLSKIKTSVSNDNLLKTTFKKPITKAESSQNQQLLNTNTKKEFLRLDINRKPKLKKKGLTVWERTHQVAEQIETRIAKELEAANKDREKGGSKEPKPVERAVSNIKLLRYNELILARPNTLKEKQIVEPSRNWENAGSVPKLIKKKISDNEKCDVDREEAVPITKKAQQNSPQDTEHPSDKKKKASSVSNDDRQLKGFLQQVQSDILEKFFSKNTPEDFLEMPEERVGDKLVREDHRERGLSKSRLPRKDSARKRSDSFQNGSSLQIDEEEEFSQGYALNEGQQLQNHSYCCDFLKAGQILMTKFGAISMLRATVQIAKDSLGFGFWRMKIHMKLNGEYCYGQVYFHNQGSSRDTPRLKGVEDVFQQFEAEVFSKSKFEQNSLDMDASQMEHRQVAFFICRSIAERKVRNMGYTVFTFKSFEQGQAHSVDFVQKPSHSSDCRLKQSLLDEHLVYLEREKNFEQLAESLESVRKQRGLYQNQFSRPKEGCQKQYNNAEEVQDESDLKSFFYEIQRDSEALGPTQSAYNLVVFPTQSFLGMCVLKHTINTQKNFRFLKAKSRYSQIQKRQLGGGLTLKTVVWQSNQITLDPKVIETQESDFKISIFSSQRRDSKAKKSSVRRNTNIKALRSSNSNSEIQSYFPFAAKDMMGNSRATESMFSELPNSATLNRILKRALIQPHYCENPILSIYYDCLVVSSFVNLMGTKSIHVKLTCFQMKSVYIRHNEEAGIFYLFELQEREARTRMHKFIMDDFQMHAFLSDKKEIPKSCRNPSKNKEEAISIANGNESPLKTERTKKLKKSIFLQGKESSQKNLSSEGNESKVNRRTNIFGRRQRLNRAHCGNKQLVVKFNKESISEALKTISPHFIIRKNYLYTKIGLEFENSTFYLANQFKSDHSALLQSLQQPEHDGESQSQIHQEYESKTSQLFESIRNAQPLGISILSKRSSENAKDSQSQEFLTRQIKSKRILCQRSVLIQVKKPQETTAYPSGRPTLNLKRRYFAVASVVKIQRSVNFTVLLYVPSLQRTYSISLDKDILSYFNNQQIRYLLDDFLQSQSSANSTSESARKCARVLEKLDLLQNNSSVEIDCSSEEDMNRQELISPRERDKRQKRKCESSKAEVLQQLSEVVFESDLQTQKKIWKRVIDIFEVFEKWTHDKSYLILKVFSYHGFIKDCSLYEYFYADRSIYQIEMSLDRRESEGKKCRQFPTPKEINSIESAIGHLKMTGHQPRRHKPKKKSHSQFMSADPQSHRNLVDPSVINQKNKEFENISKIYESKCEEYILYIQLCKVSHSKGSSEAPTTTKTIDYELQELEHSNAGSGDLFTNSETENGPFTSMHKCLRKTTQKNTLKSTTKSITFYTKPVPSSQEYFRKRRRLKSNYKRVGKEKITRNRFSDDCQQDGICEGDREESISKINFSFYLSELVTLLKFVGENYCHQFQEEYFTLSQIRSALQLLKKTVLEQINQTANPMEIFSTPKSQMAFKSKVLEQLNKAYSQGEICRTLSAELNRPKFISLHSLQQSPGSSSYLISLNILSVNAHRLCSLFFMSENLLFLISGTRKFCAEAVVVKPNSEAFIFMNSLIEKDSGLKCVKTRIFKYYRNLMLLSTKIGH